MNNSRRLVGLIPWFKAPLSKPMSSGRCFYSIRTIQDIEDANEYNELKRSEWAAKELKMQEAKDKLLQKQEKREKIQSVKDENKKEVKLTGSGIVF
ncbi:hypothetical protein DFA_07450 [Cavenderia fasciculata]|uniref:Uncharacterized protein n=1 Tax=Cavenderia fasciculata TaxID=261658 RepID=F4PWG2_CACFS|nr:uncharacterized protein DFA_07450 [Cavenderia fasciculata]EGG20326.1 hypothetical protein DFA_07450 [Cavenderia fasciculata]|eukprot:XP_004367309.1 hypothetical protein DFA_07450 [Cavenderia fasciculata]